MQLASGDLRPAAILLLCTCSIAAGCSEDGPAIGELSGTVTFEGQPVTDGIINFESAAGFGVSVPLTAEGTFELASQYGSGIPQGSYRVSVTPPPPPVDPSQPAGGTSGPPPDPKNIPRKYRDFSTSGLTVEVTEISSVVTFDLMP